MLEGRTYLSEAMTQQTLDRLATGAPADPTNPADLLSDRELELFELTGQGLSIAEIGEKMHISPRTVEVHRSHIKRKLGLRTSTDIFQAAYEWRRQNNLNP